MTTTAAAAGQTSDPAPLHPARPGALTMMMAGNFVIGTGVLAPAAMMNQLVAAFATTPQDVGHLVTWGAVVLCIGAPLLAFALSRVPRRLLLCLCMAVYAVGHVASGLVDTLGALLLVRLLLVPAAAVFTPQAAGVLGLLVSPARRAGSVAYVFIGWSLAAALGVPLMALVAEAVGWQTSYMLLGAVSAVVMAGLWILLPPGLIVPPLGAAQWRRVLTSGPILAILAVTLVQLAGQFALFPYLAAEMKRKTGAGPDLVAALLGLYGLAGALGGLAISRLANRLGAANGLLVCLAFMAVGLALWSITGSSVALAAVAVSVWGSGFAAGNAMQQARLIGVAPELGSASVALNTSVLYLGQAIGAAVGGAFIASGQYPLMGWFAFALVSASALMSIGIQRTYKA
jgi:MFS transporter, DHA1 family, inner membrane transport protein